MLGRRAREVFGAEVMSIYLPTCREVVATGLPQHFETHFPANGRHYLSAVFLLDPEHYVNISVDITERKLAVAQLERRNAELQQEIQVRQGMEAKVRRLNAQLEERVRERTAELEAANRELEAFSYSVSHDLRAPLRVIGGFSRALLEDGAEALGAAGCAHLDRVCAAARRMEQLIDDLLQLSLVTRCELRREEVDLSRLARDIAQKLQETEPGRPVEWCIAGGLRAPADARLMQVALENLLGNAWKFTARHPQARIELGRAEGAGRGAFFVRDDGAGFDMAQAGKLFNTFQRLHRQEDFAGTGIGLALVQRIIRRLGGEVWGEGAVEQGATIYFTLAAQTKT